MDVVYVGGTSIGTYHTKGLSALFLHVLFMELTGTRRSGSGTRI